MDWSKSPSPGHFAVIPGPGLLSNAERWGRFRNWFGVGVSSSSWGVPSVRWLVDFREIPNLQWMLGVPPWRAGNLWRFWFHHRSKRIIEKQYPLGWRSLILPFFFSDSTVVFSWDGDPSWLCHRSKSVFHGQCASSGGNHGPRFRASDKVPGRVRWPGGGVVQHRRVETIRKMWRPPKSCVILKNRW